MSFSKSVPVYFDRSSSARKLSVTISVTYESSVSHASSPPCDKDFCVQLTKEDDPLFLYTSRLSPTDFANLKQEQNLLVDFTGFPRMFTDLLENIIADDSKTEPKLILCFTSNNSDQAILEIVEPNKFKRMVHLALKLAAASDLLIKSHLATALQSMKQRLQAFESHCKSMENEVKRKVLAAQEAYKGKAADLEKTKKKHVDEVDEIRKTHANALIECEETLGKQSRDLFDQHQQSLKSIERLENENKMLSEDLDEGKHRIDRLASENEKYEDNLRQWQERYADVERELDEVPILRGQLDEAERAIENLEIQLSRGKEKFSALAKQKDQLLNDLENVESKLGFEKGETAKSVQVIGTVMAKLKQEQTKVKTQSDIILKQETRIKDLESNLQNLNTNLENDHAKCSNMGEENQRLVIEIAQLSEKCASFEKDKSQKDALIRYLNNQLDSLKMSSLKCTPGPLSGDNRPVSFRPVLGLTQPTASTSTPTNYRFSSRFDAALSPIANPVKPAALLEPNLPNLK